MKLSSKLLLMLPLLFAIVLVGCDDSSSNAQTMDDPNACPCFSAEDIKDDAMGKDFFGCSVNPNALAVSLDLSEGQTEFTISVDCPDASFGFCQCVDGVRNVTSDSVTKEQFFDCTDIVTDAIINEFGQQSMSMCLITN